MGVPQRYFDRRPQMMFDMEWHLLVIPDEELSGGTRQLGEFFFAPGEDMVINQLRRGHICAQVIAIPTIDIEVDNIDHRWCWTSF